MSDYKNSLEIWVAEQLKQIDPHARPTRGSGCGNEIGDVSNTSFYVECKIRKSFKDVSMKIDVWKNLINKMPLNTCKTPIYVTENKEGDKFVILNAEEFFDLIKENKQ